MKSTLKRRMFLTGAAGFAAACTFPATLPAASPATVFYRNPGCTCCEAWGKQMTEAGFPIDMRDSDDLDAFQAASNFPADLRGCHAGVIGGYSVTGHVPPADIKRLLAEKPDATGLAVPGMPGGSPGMEGAGQEAYEVILFRKDGSREVFARYA